MGRRHVGPRLQPPCSTRRRPDIEVHMHVRRVSVSAQPSTTHPSTDTGRPCRFRLGEGPDPHLHESSVAARGQAPPASSGRTAPFTELKFRVKQKTSVLDGLKDRQI